jgi:predicted SAM-dependent methyltransferase
MSDQMLVNAPAKEAKAPEAVPAAAPTKPILLDLACGQNPREGYEGVDIWSGAKHVADLWKFPWPWADSSVDTLHCSHHIEHIPAREVEARDLLCDPKKDGIPAYEAALKEWVGKDMFLAFFDECWRILKPNGKMSVITPCARNNRAFQDPTHRRFIVAETFLYLHEPFRKANKLDHYRVRCNFSVQADPVVQTEMTLLHPEAQQRRFTESWNTILDWSANLVAIKEEKKA